MERAPRPSATSANPKPDGALPDAPGPSVIARQQALRFLTGDGQLTQAAMVGLHQALGAPALVRKVIAARKRGVRFGGQGGQRDIRAVVAGARLEGEEKGRKAQADGREEDGGQAPATAADGVEAETATASSREGEEGGEGEPVATGVEGTNEAATAEAQSQGVQRQVRLSGRPPDHDPVAVREAAAQGVSGAGAPLPHGERIQQSFGREHDLSGVRAHVGGTAGRAAREMGAEAYATGDAIAFAEPPDLRLAAHEAAHVVQQRAGADLPGGVGRPGDAHERSADAVADRVVAGQSAADLLPSLGGAAAQASVQCRLRLGGADLDPAGVTRAVDGLVRTQLRDIIPRPVSESLVRETVRELHATSDTHDFPNLDALASNVRQRVLTSQYMRRSQGSTPHNMAFSYPDSRNDGTAGIGPKVNDAAVAFWGPVQGGDN